MDIQITEGRCFGIVPADMLDGATLTLDPPRDERPYLNADQWRRLGEPLKRVSK